MTEYGCDYEFSAHGKTYVISASKDVYGGGYSASVRNLEGGWRPVRSPRVGIAFSSLEEAKREAESFLMRNTEF